jgi:hypothetical protein
VAIWPPAELLHDFETIFFDDRIGENFFGDAFEVFLSFIVVPAVQIEDEEFPLADVFDGCVTKPGEGVLDRLALGIEYRALWHHPDVCFHEASIALGQRRESGRSGLAGSGLCRDPLETQCKQVPPASYTETKPGEDGGTRACRFQE